MTKLEISVFEVSVCVSADVLANISVVIIVFDIFIIQFLLDVGFVEM